MKEINLEDTKEITGGASISGALVTGIAKVIQSGFEGISNFITDVASIGFAFYQANKNPIKAEYKIGNNSFKIDNTKLVDLKIQQSKVQEIKIPVLEVGNSKNNININYNDAYNNSDSVTDIYSDFDQSISIFD
ncbi:hypothetical protein FOY66_02210 [Mycoplasma capricolum subsp. capripneumoniae]|uniref:hypothetical protein n=1 Tax=Mycoplasma capricolum TaxID=2095 RepID=UPI0004D7B870|nr:hypothetical protein [Mycoplasma capricolum]AQU77505.1 hypothetical protein BVA24_02235 [Mycoplasma capricolum subsp. capripneumoniae]KEY84517.1 hypothetical protein MCCP_4280 [Mycoplasma capricolum subsp. capripneumoniae 99108]QDL19593.1 hypothetical protein DQW15_02225 [Mycoplasma capricolum subsp. capripneumoniae]QDL20278.1 hypothetical protein DQW16_02225 [Mycoplasma capricolum subsp. capripneumoniae]QDL20965.1 hypothetical protein DQW17_02225 [Mycoplasma capricolum subsp. capripneumoni